MSRRLMTHVVTHVTLLFLVTATFPAFAGSASTAGARPAAGGEASRSIDRGASQSAPASFQEITAAFTATPTIGSLGDAVEASRSTFSSGEAIEFDVVLFESGLRGTSANLELFVFNPQGQLVVPIFFFNGVVAPADRTGFFIQLNPGSLPTGRLKWAMVIFDAFGNLFVTPFEALEVQ
jgi:hypothetical protein